MDTPQAKAADSAGGLQDPGECVVCGKATTLRCERCSKSGILWMYFCSIGHQKLIWKVHKGVCGKNPFEFPPLTGEEAKQAFDLRDSPLGGEDPNKTLMDDFNSILGRAGIEIDSSTPKEERKSRRDEIFKFLLSDLKKSQHSRHWQLFLFTLRSNIIKAKMRSGLTYSEYLQMLSNEPHALMARAMCRASLPDDGDYPSTFKHRLVIFFAIVSIEVAKSVETRRPLDWVKSEHLQHTRSVLLSSSSIAEISRDHPAKAREMMEKMITTVLESTRATYFRTPDALRSKLRCEGGPLDPKVWEEVD